METPRLHKRGAILVPLAGVPQQLACERCHAEEALILGIEMDQSGLVRVHERVPILVHLGCPDPQEAVGGQELEPHNGTEIGGIGGEERAIRRGRGEMGRKKDARLYRLHPPAPPALLPSALLDPVELRSHGDILSLELQAALDLEVLLLEETRRSRGR